MSFLFSVFLYQNYPPCAIIRVLNSFQMKIKIHGNHLILYCLYFVAVFKRGIISFISLYILYVSNYISSELLQAR
jgi:hypothetical protein